MAREQAEREREANRCWQRLGERLAWWICERPSIGTALCQGSLNARLAMGAADEYTAAAAVNWQRMQKHHRTLRAASEAEEAYAPMALQGYAEAMQQVAQRPWHRQGIRWCRARCREFFREGWAARLQAKEARRLHFQRTSRRMTDQEAASALAHAEQHWLRGLGGRLRLLDVGSCGSLFETFEDFLPTALDLCPAHPNTYECDFLKLEIGKPDSAPEADPPLQTGRGRLRRLPAEGFEVVVMSCVLSYMPRPAHRSLAVEKAHRLLAEGGLLLIVDTFTVDRRAAGLHEGSMLREWRLAVEAMGFQFLRYELLPNSHALAFARRGRASEPPPPFRIRLEADMDHARALRHAKQP